MFRTTFRTEPRPCFCRSPARGSARGVGGDDLYSTLEKTHSASLVRNSSNVTPHDESGTVDPAMTRVQRARASTTSRAGTDLRPFTGSAHSSKMQVLEADDRLVGR